MDWKTFIVEVVKAIIWPAVIVYIIFQLKDRIGELLPRLKKFKFKDTELEFAEIIEKLATEAKEQNNIPLEPEKAPEDLEQFNFLVKLAQISPRSAVIESFRSLENASAKTLVKLYPEIDPNKLKNPLNVIELLSGKALNPNQIHRFHELRKLRNKAAHMEDFELESMPVEAYIDMALTLAYNLDNYNP